MIDILLCLLIVFVLAAGAYYAAYRWVDLRHNRDTLADELTRATAHIEDLEARISLMEAERDLREYKAMPKEETTGWETFSIR